jgi:hypothetical protein
MANPLGDDEDDEDEGGGAKEPERETDPWIKRSMATFYKVFGALLTDENTQRFFWVAFDLAQYVCRRLEPEPIEVSSWLSRLVRMYHEDAVDVERRDTIAAATPDFIDALSFLQRSFSPLAANVFEPP